MKRLIFITFLLISVPGWTQNSLSRLYMHDPVLINPAFVGLDNPTTMTAYYDVLQPESTGNPSSLSIIGGHHIDKFNSSVGLYLSSFQAGALTDLSAGVLINKHFTIGVKGKLALAFVPFRQISTIDHQFYRVIDSDDPLLLASDPTSSAFDANFGITFIQHGFRTSLSISNIFEGDFDYGTNLEQRSNKRAYTAFVSRDLQVTDKFEVTPSTLLSVIDLESMIDINTVFTYSNLLVAGGGYRIHEVFDNQFSLNGGVIIGKQIHLFVTCYSSFKQDYKNDGINAEVVLRYTPINQQKWN